MDLLEKASVILTPTAYNNGEALCVKPSDGSGDFDFSRNSAATRVNAQGLVENVQILSSNLVQNGDFSEEGVQEVSNGSFSQEGSELITNGDFATDSDWGLGTNWSISGGSLNAAAATATAFQQNTGIVTNKTYKVTYTISNYVSGSVRIEIGSANVSVGIIRSANGTYTEYITALGDDAVYFDGISAFTGSIDNFSVREVGQDWTLQTGWSIAEDKATCDGTTENLDQDALTIGNSYKAQFTVSDLTTGTLSFRLGGTNEVININSNGTYTAYGVANGVTLRLRSQSGFNGSVTNISVKEVGMDWTLGTGWSIGENKASCDGTNGSRISQDVGFQASKTYRFTIEVSDYTSGSIGFQYYNGGYVSFGSMADGVKTIEFTITGTDNGFLYIRSTNFIGSITNISVIEITDDTNLPRINYEGFSYQDALGSEQVVNGTFDNGTAWILSNSTISNGELNILTASINNTAQQSISGLTVGANYKIEYDINSISNGGLVAYEASHSRPAYETNVGTYSNIFTATATTQTIYIRTSGATTATIDNVSVKEYLGQSVVPNSGCGSWLWEPQSTNLITYSEDFSQWANSSATVNFEESVINPSGNLGTYKLIPNTPLQAFHFISLSISPSSSSSVFAKKGEYNYLRLSNPSSGSGGVIFDLVNGTTNEIGTDITSSKMTDFGNGWWRCESVNSNVAGGTYSLHAQPIDTDGAYQGDGTSGVYIWGANATNDQDYATSYIPTSGSQVTRNQDVCTNGATGTGLINSTEGVLYAEIAALSDDGTFKFISLNTNASNRLRLGYSSTTNKISVLIQVDGAVKFNNSQIGNINQVDFNKIAVSYSASGVKVFVNGVEVNSNTVNSSFALLNKLDFRDGDTLNPFFGKTKAVAVFPYLTDQELTELTTI